MNVVLLCIGAAKAGTDWLHRQLSAHPECHLRTIKELHYFDALESGRLDNEMTKHRREQDNLLRHLAADHSVPDADQARRLADRTAWIKHLKSGQEDLPGYLAYLNEGASAGQVVGEMTPSYALLPTDRLRAMAEMAPDVRFVYLLRDPVERLWSHVRMIAVRRDPNGKLTRQRAARILARTIAGEEEQIACRSDYADTLARLTKAVPGPQVLVDVFEEMVKGDGLLRLCSFLGIAPMTGDPGLVHVGQPLEMTRDQRRAAAQWLAPQYDAAAKTLGRMPKAWGREG
ncbi:MAG: hypothetical protein HKN18_03775 [Silicimonas sp.]|nr:hypothetical protein [Silicimonas sp.]